jgi:[protein-PII] uridylyltransferase
MLTLHTFVDSVATSDQLWNGFKDSLHWTLYHRAMTVLTGGTDFIRAEDKERELLAEEITRAAPKSFHTDEIAAHFGALPARYYQVREMKDIMTDLAMVHRFMHFQLVEEEKALEPVIVWHNEPDRGYSRANVCTWNRAGLFAKLAGSFSAAGINILGAQIFSRMDGIVLDTFFVTDGHTGGLVDRGSRERFEGIVTRALTAERIDLHALIARQKKAHPTYQAVEGESIPTRISFDNNGDRTAIDIETEDRLGVLYTLSEVLTEVGLDISLAKIYTEKGAVMDTFYVSEDDGRKVTDPERQKYIRDRLRAAIAAMRKE